MSVCSNYRIFVEKKADFQVEANSLKEELSHNLNIAIQSLRLINVYDVFNIDEILLKRAIQSVFSEPVTDDATTAFEIPSQPHFAIEFLPGQFDQRADSAMQCLSLLDPKTEAVVKSGKLIIVDNGVTTSDLNRIKHYCINEVEAREKDMAVFNAAEKVDVADVPVYDGFIAWSPQRLEEFRQQMSLAMSAEDLLFIQRYFCEDEKRNPTETEIKMLDTYWSDHCRHTTFETELQKITFESSVFEQQMQEAYNTYMEMRHTVHGCRKPVTLMDMATISGKYERKIGNLDDMEISDEINACSVYVDVDVNGQMEKWLLMFKNETHNHPTEIEPFGGAATCIGGAIRDPLSGRSYVYQAMRVTGAGDITEPVDKTIEGKLPQQVISKSAAAGYSSYGNQIGLATTHVREIFHEGYKAKRMEVGVVVGAAPAATVKREKPVPGDIIIMFGGRTGRDGIGGATGSSKEHTETSLEVCAAEVQKGNAPEERKIQHLFRNPKATRLVKKSNDFGAGGVSVAIGELADGLLINLDAVKTKYKGLNGTEIAISESQERMSVVVDKNDVDEFFELCRKENIEATIIATVTDDNRLRMTWNGKMIVDLSRDFINTNGVRPNIKATVAAVNEVPAYRYVSADNATSFENRMLAMLAMHNVASQKGLIEMFDATIGASTVLMPFGGKTQLSETQVSVQKLPVMDGKTDTASIVAYGFNPYISSASPFHGAMYAVIESIAKIVAAGGDYHRIRFSFQEYFEKLGKDEVKWGKPFAALLGSIYVQNKFHLPSIGGKDSMSGTFKNLHVPPTLISFAVTTGKASQIISPEFKKKGNYIYWIKDTREVPFHPDIERLKKVFDYMHEQILNKHIVSAFTLQFGGVAEALFKMSVGNGLGFNVQTKEDLFAYAYGSFVVESTVALDSEFAVLLGTVEEQYLVNGETIDRQKCLAAWSGTFGKIYPATAKACERPANMPAKQELNTAKVAQPVSEPEVLLPVFPGTNCDYDTARAFNNAGAKSTIFVFRNLNEKEITDSINEMAELLDRSHILALSGGFSSGDEPDGSGKFIANVLTNATVKAAVERLLARGGLIVGICNGFQALVKSGLLPFGQIGSVTADSPTLTRNDINRHVSHITHTVVNSVKSPWLTSFKSGEIHRVAISHGEGKFVVSEEIARQLFANGQVAFQYCDAEGEATMNPEFNPNGSYYAIEGIVSPDGRILGKMGHSERKGENLYKNIDGNKEQDIFANAVNYFKGL